MRFMVHKLTYNLNVGDIKQYAKQNISYVHSNFDIFAEGYIRRGSLKYMHKITYQMYNRHHYVIVPSLLY